MRVFKTIQINIQINKYYNENQCRLINLLRVEVAM